MKKIISVILLFSVFISGCSLVNTNVTEEYVGEELKIGIIGEVSKVRESQVEFEEIDFKYLVENDFDSSYDAIFITKENLSKAADNKYIPIYKQSEIPFYFIESEKGYISFIEEHLSYENAPENYENMYIIGLLHSKDSFWAYGLYNDTENKTNIKSTYSSVFGDISKIKNGELP